MYDGWETRRRRGVTGNYPPQISVEAAYVVGHPPVEELVEKTQWTSLVERSDINGNARNPFGVNWAQRWSHVLQLTENRLLPGAARTMGEGLMRLRLWRADAGWRR